MDGRERARRAYERGRIGMALAHAAPALLFGVGSVMFANNGGAGLLWSAGLGIAAAALVYFGGPSGRAVPAGLAAGFVPFALPLVVRGQVCPMGGSCDTWCLTACAVAGVVAGAWLGWRSAREPGGLVWLATGITLAAVCGSLGCVWVGVPGVAGILGGALAAAPIMRMTRFAG